MPGRINLTVEVTPTPAVLAQGFFITSDKLRQLEEPLQRCAPILQNEVQTNFEMQGRPSKWADLSEETMLKRIKGSLTSDQRSALADLKADSAFEGELVTPPEGGDAVFIPSETNKYSQVLAGLASGIRILVATGELEGGATAGDYIVRRHDARSVSMEVNDPTGYGVFHVIGRANMPIRDWSYIAEEAVDECAEVFTEWVGEAIQS